MERKLWNRALFRCIIDTWHSHTHTHTQWRNPSHWAQKNARNAFFNVIHFLRVCNQYAANANANDSYLVDIVVVVGFRCWPYEPNAIVYRNVNKPVEYNNRNWLQDPMLLSILYVFNSIRLTYLLLSKMWIAIVYIEWNEHENKNAETIDGQR